MHTFKRSDHPLSAVHILRLLGLVPDPWQLRVLESDHRRLLLNCSRQAGKSTVAAVLALVEALSTPLARILIVSRSHRQARELYRQLLFFYDLLGHQLQKRRTANELELNNLSRIVCVPCREDTIRGFANAALIVIDEAARVPDELYRAVRPMLAVSGGKLLCLSTPFGRRGFFYEAWANGGDDWLRFEVTAAQVPRIAAEFLAEERRAHGEAWFRQEYFCSFESVEGLVYPDFARCVVPALPEHVHREDAGWRLGGGARVATPGRSCRRVGGLDFGFRNPFAALWGLLDRDDVLWLVGEHYLRQRPVSHHAVYLPRDVFWYADPSGANERAELIRADFTVAAGLNELRSGIAAVTARLESGRLRVLEGGCPNLLAEAALYRYDEAGASRRGEQPHDEHNHALAALRYLIATLDAGRQVRPGKDGGPAQQETPEQARARRQRQHLWHSPNVWHTF